MSVYVELIKVCGIISLYSLKESPVYLTISCITIHWHLGTLSLKKHATSWCHLSIRSWAMHSIPSFSTCTLKHGFVHIHFLHNQQLMLSGQWHSYLTSNSLNHACFFSLGKSEAYAFICFPSLLPRKVQ